MDLSQKYYALCLPAGFSSRAHQDGIGGKMEGKVRVLILLASCLLDLCKLAGPIYWGPQFQSSCPYSFLHGFWEPLLTSSDLEKVATVLHYPLFSSFTFIIVPLKTFLNYPVWVCHPLFIEPQHILCWAESHLKKHVMCWLYFNEQSTCCTEKQKNLVFIPAICDLALWPQAVKIYFNFFFFDHLIYGRHWLEPGNTKIKNTRYYAHVAHNSNRWDRYINKDL